MQRLRCASTSGRDPRTTLPNCSVLSLRPDTFFDSGQISESGTSCGTSSLDTLGNVREDVNVQRQRIVSEVHDEFVEQGRMHVPPDDTSHDGDIAFWDEVKQRLREAGIESL